MISVYIYAFLSVLAVSLVSLIGVFTLSLKEKFIQHYIFIFISLAVGSLLGDAFLHLIPEAITDSPFPMLSAFLVIVGILVFFILEKFLHWHHHGEDTTKPHIQPIGSLILLSDGVHNFIDGVVIGASFFVSLPVGFATTLAVVLHEIPQEVGDFTVLVHAGYRISRALWLNFLSALAAVFGVIIAFLLGQFGEYFLIWILPFTAGGFIYIAMTDLIPELQKTKEIKHFVSQTAAFIIGVLIMVVLVLFE